MKVYHPPLLTVKILNCCDIITESVVDDTQDFSLGWIGK